ncbi:L-cysteine desulfidase family protein [Alkaliphilus hydrothermalis]|uniref:UPF0597 protein JOC73_002067 n=1 Tax=Alkaliphilus hydrothermalis TaxID=1482730 RepID=A0ABS2NRU6_9FIRM|nr:L-serine ammonia-lyase, iron-sulfur-dependent, subunit alpha [Alkaliphilus hydrothermalis]MBM7615497.1 L-cysteine desulfidase [Alkaliphilus hydrothermalis]
MMEFGKIKKILEGEVIPALGCTEPVAVALASATAREIIGGKPQKIKVTVSSNVYKNAMAVGIPGTVRVGIDIAASLGVFGGDASKGLEVLSNVEKGLEEAIAFVTEKNVQVEVSNKMGVFIDCTVITDSGEGRCVIQDSHTNITLVEKNGMKVNQCMEAIQDHKEEKDALVKWLQEKSIDEIIDTARIIPFEEIEPMLEGRNMNLAVAKVGLAERAGMGVGFLSKGRNITSREGYAATLTAAGADVRMAGVKMPVMSSAGSGNHGITAILPVVAIAEMLEKNDEDLARALALSHLITVYIKSHTGKLSPLCGCAVAAGIGASTGIALLMEADNEQIKGAIKNMAANITGMICDGGKVGCALKLYSAASTAYLSAELAIQGSIVPSDNGIIHENIEKTIRNMGKLSYLGMQETDRVILEIMMENNGVQEMYCS